MRIITMIISIKKGGIAAHKIHVSQMIRLNYIRLQQSGSNKYVPYLHTLFMFCFILIAIHIQFASEFLQNINQRLSLREIYGDRNEYILNVFYCKRITWA